MFSLLLNSCKLYFPVLWFRIGFNADADPDPAFNLIADPDPRSQQMRIHADPDPSQS
jgi:hypothetical protein